MSRRVEHVAVKEGYERWASVYDHDGNPLIALDDRVVPTLLGDVRGVDVLELACGTGRHTERLVDGGARVTALDFSPNMLAVARARLAAKPVTFLEGNLLEPLAFAEHSFDLVVCCLALEHLPALAPVFHEVRRVLRTPGAFVCSDMHPAMRLRGNQAAFDDADGGDVRVEGYEHSVVDYVLAALAAGLVPRALGEHKGDAELLASHPRIGKYVGWPMLFTMRAENAA